MNEIAHILRTTRHKCGRTLVDVANEAGVSVAYLSDLERGIRTPLNPGLESLNRILACYGLEVVTIVRVKPE